MKKKKPKPAKPVKEPDSILKVKPYNEVGTKKVKRMYDGSGGGGE